MAQPPHITQWGCQLCHQWRLPTIRKTRHLLQTLIKEFSFYVRQFRLTVLYNKHWNTIRIRHPWQIKVSCDFLTNLKVSKILCSFRLVLDRKTGKEIRWGILSEICKALSKVKPVENRSKNLQNFCAKRSPSFTKTARSYIWVVES